MRWLRQATPRCMHGNAFHGRIFSLRHTYSTARKADVNYEEDLLSPLDLGPDPKSGRSLYHAILIQLNLFSDRHCSDLIKHLVRKRYLAAREAPAEKAPRLRINAKKCLITLQKANQGDQRSMAKVVQSAYAQRGIYRHKYMADLVSDMTEPENELIPGRPRTRPPSVGARLRAIWDLQFAEKKTTLVLPSGLGGVEYGKPLAKSRESNIRWQHHCALLNQTLPPIPIDQYEHIKAIASGEHSLALKKVPAWRTKTHKEMLNRHKHTKSRIPTPSLRNYRRAYDKVMRRSPVLTKTPAGWSAYYYPGPNQEGQDYRKVSSLDPSEFDPIVPDSDQSSRPQTAVPQSAVTSDSGESVSRNSSDVVHKTEHVSTKASDAGHETEHVSEWPADIEREDDRDTDPSGPVNDLDRQS